MPLELSPPPRGGVKYCGCLPFSSPPLLLRKALACALPDVILDLRP